MSRPKPDLTWLQERTATLGEARGRALYESVVDRVARRERNVRRARLGAALAVAMTAVALLVRQVSRPAPIAVVASPPPPAPSGTAAEARPELGGVVLADGTRVTFLEAGTELVQSGGTGRQATIVRGVARFDVVHNGATPFRVIAGSVVIEDLGTVFTVRQSESGTTIVSIQSGSVSVRQADQEQVLVAGTSAAFERSAPAAAPTPSTALAHKQAVSWQKLARAGDYDRAYALIEVSAVRDDADDLLLAADAARLSNHPDRAVPLLRRFLARFSTDSRASLATFALGRILLDDLDQPSDAARVFASAYAAGGPLAEDALVREVEGWSRAGDAATAKRAADQYAAAYPAGRRSAYVRRLAGEH
jgi:hypothetical protein